MWRREPSSSRLRRPFTRIRAYPTLPIEDKEHRGRVDPRFSRPLRKFPKYLRGSSSYLKVTPPPHTGYMEVLDPVWLMSGLKRIVIGSATRAEIGVALERIRTVRARADAAEVAFAQRLRELTPLADGDTAKAAQRHARHGDQVRTRGETAALIPALGTAFGAGDVSGEHVDAVTKALKAAPETVRDLLRDAAGEIVGDVAASGLTPQELAQRLADETKRLEDDDGMARLERQRRATRLRTWTDKHDGTFRIAGTFDPLSGLAIQGRLAAAMAAMFANGIPDLAPDDPSERQDFLRALALIALTAGRPGSTGRPGSRNTGNNTATGTESSPGSEHDQILCGHHSPTPDHHGSGDPKSLSWSITPSSIRTVDPASTGAPQSTYRSRVSKTLFGSRPSTKSR